MTRLFVRLEKLKLDTKMKLNAIKYEQKTGKFKQMIIHIYKTPQLQYQRTTGPIKAHLRSGICDLS